MTPIVRIKFGSHLYGTQTPASDVDYKSVYVPSARDILLQRVKGSVSTKRPKREGEKNYAGEVDEESYSLQRYLGHVAEGQTVALDVLFAPRWSMEAEPLWVWREIVENRERLVTRRYAAFIGYCRTQANKYGIRGSRVATAREALAEISRWVEANSRSDRLADFADKVWNFALLHTGHSRVTDIEQANGTFLPHWEVCNRKLSFSASIGNAQDVVARIFAEYGARALEAERNEGVDWKALSHAVRIGHQAIELLRTGNVEFPRPDAPHLVAIKRGELPYREVAEEIEALLPAVEEEAARSSLRETPDYEWIDDYVAEIHAAVVRGVAL